MLPERAQTFDQRQLIAAVVFEPEPIVERQKGGVVIQAMSSQTFGLRREGQGGLHDPCVDLFVAQRRLAAGAVTQRLIGIAVAVEVRMQPALVARPLDAGMSYEKGRANTVSIEQFALVGEILVRRPFHIDGETYSAGVEARRPTEICGYHDTDELGQKLFTLHGEPPDYRSAGLKSTRAPADLYQLNALCYQVDMHTDQTRNSRGERHFVEPPAPSGEPHANRRSALGSVIVPVYNERDNVRAMHDALCTMALSEPTFDWEFLFVEDGSTDNTFAFLADLNRADPRVKVVRLSRNYGSHVAAAAGLQFASGDAAVIIAGDMQDHPCEIPRFLAKWREGFHVVWGVRATRPDGRVDRLLSAMFSALIRREVLPNYPKKGTGSFCLLDRKVIDGLNAFPERNRLISGLILIAGFRQTQIEYDRLERHAGVSKWSLRQKIKLTIDTIVSFSSIPIRLTSILGIISAVLSFIYAAYLTVDTVLYGRAVEGWATIIVLILGLGGLQLFALGMLGEYLWRVSDEVRRRPLFLVQETAGVSHVMSVRPSLRCATNFYRRVKIDDQR